MRIAVNGDVHFHTRSNNHKKIFCKRVLTGRRGLVVVDGFCKIKVKALVSL